MLAIIAPVKQFIVNYKINNPVDTNTYFVRAVIKDAATGATLTTLDLDDNGSKFYSKSWVTPNDPSGNGRQIVIFKTVYDDAGYTTESVNYGTEVDNILILQPITPYGSFGAGTGGSSGGNNVQSGPSLRDFREVLETVLAERIPKQDKTSIDLSELVGEIGGLKKDLLSRFRQKMAELFKLGEKAQDFAQLNQTIVDNIQKLLDLSVAVKKDITSFSQLIKTATEGIPDKLDEIVSAAGKTLSDKAEEIIDDSSKRLNNVLKEGADQIVSKVQKSIEKTLNEPMQVTLFNDVVLKRKKEEKQEDVQDQVGDSRVERLMKHIGA